MPSLNMVLEHQLSPEETLRRMSDFLEKTLVKIEEDRIAKIGRRSQIWSGSNSYFIFKANGVAVAGSIEIGLRTVQIRGELPLGDKSLADKIELAFRKQAMALLS